MATHTKDTLWLQQDLCSVSATDIIPFNEILYLVITEWLITRLFIPLS